MKPRLKDCCATPCHSNGGLPASLYALGQRSFSFRTTTVLILQDTITSKKKIIHILDVRLRITLSEAAAESRPPYATCYHCLSHTQHSEADRP